MRTPASPEPLSRPQIRALDALILSGDLARGSRRHGPARPSRPEDAPAPAAPDEADPPILAKNGVEFLQAPQWQPLEWLWHGFSTRRICGSAPKAELNLGFTEEEDRAAILRNRHLFVEAVTGDPATPLVTVKQIHSSLVVRAGLADAGAQSPRKADGLITDQPGLLLAVMTADCIPVLVADRRRRVVAAFHAGWRGTVKRIVEGGVGRMRLEFGSRPEDLLAAIGPGIGGCCYAVGEEVLAAFQSQFAYAPELFTEVYDPDPVRQKYPMLFLNQRAPGHASPMLSLHLDLIEANRRQLLDAGLKPDRIQRVGSCTNCHPRRFFSHRAEHGRAGRMMTVIGIRDAKT